jgi:hypothetical protein
VRVDSRRVTRVLAAIAPDEGSEDNDRWAGRLHRRDENCVEGKTSSGGPADLSPCTLMFNSDRSGIRRAGGLPRASLRL